MGMIDTLRSWWFGKQAPPPQKPVNRGKIVEMPVSGGYRGSVSPTSIEAQLNVEGVFLSRPLTDEDYDMLYELGRKNHDVSFAKDNVVQLASAKINYEFDLSVPAAQVEKMRAELNRVIPTWYDGGTNSLVNALFRQIQMFGCISGEAQPNANLRGVGRVVLLSPKFVYFGWDAKKQDWVPYQSGTVFNQTNNSSLFNRLNEWTYKYVAYEKWREDIPYAVPPVWSSVRAACIEDKMLDNVVAITSRLGMLGFLQVIVNAPSRAKRSDGRPETDQEYQARVATYLESLSGEVEKSFANGYVVAAKQMIEGKEVKPEFVMTPTATNTAGLTGLAEYIISVKAAGLKQDPSMLGKNFGTTETLISTVLKKFTNQLINFQEYVCQFLEHAAALHLRLLGYKFEYLNVSMETPTLMDASMEYDGLQKKFTYYKSLYDQGIIDQMQFAQAMGYDSPSSPAPPAPPAPEQPAPEMVV